MTAQEWMAILYPVLTFVAFVRGCIAIIYFFTVRRGAIVLSSAAIYLTEALVLLILTISTGSNPLYDISTFRPFIVAARFLLLAAFAWSCWESFKMILKNGTTATRKSWVIDTSYREA